MAMLYKLYINGPLGSRSSSGDLVVQAIHPVHGFKLGIGECISNLPIASCSCRRNSTNYMASFNASNFDSRKIIQFAYWMGYCLCIWCLWSYHCDYRVPRMPANI
jgi:hypothetical protein